MLRRLLTSVAGHRAVQQEGERGRFLNGGGGGSGGGGGGDGGVCCCCCPSVEGHLPDICNKKNKCLVICFSPLKLIRYTRHRDSQNAHL